MLRLLLVEDHHLVRHGMRALIDQTGKYEVVAEAHSCADIVPLVEKHAADIVLLDLSLKDGSTLEMIQPMRKMPTNPRILVLSMRDDAYTVQTALKKGANGFLSKRSVQDELQIAIETVWEEERYLCRHARSVLAAIDTNHSFGEPLTGREKQILELIASGLTTREMALDLNISHKTIEKHRLSVMRKLGAQNMVELLTTAHQRHLISDLDR